MSLDNYADYLFREADLETALRFLRAAQETFSLLASHPNLGWESHLQNPVLRTLRVFRVKGFEKLLILYRPLPIGVDILRVVHGSRKLTGAVPSSRRDRVALTPRFDHFQKRPGRVTQRPLRRI